MTNLLDFDGRAATISAAFVAAMTIVAVSLSHGATPAHAAAPGAASFRDLYQTTGFATGAAGGRGCILKPVHVSMSALQRVLHARPDPAA